MEKVRKSNTISLIIAITMSVSLLYVILINFLVAYSSRVLQYSESELIYNHPMLYNNFKITIVISLLSIIYLKYVDRKILIYLYNGRK